MRVLVKGHKYQVEGGQIINFVHKVKDEGTDTLKLIQAGTTNEELLKVLIDRTKTLQGAVPCVENEAALAHMQAALDAFESRTAKRKNMGVEGTDKLA